MVSMEKAMNTPFKVIALASILLLAYGCGNDTTPVLDTDLLHADTTGQDIHLDNHAPTDNQGADTAAGDVANGDTADSTGEDVPGDVENDTTIPVPCTFNNECDPERFCRTVNCGGQGVCALKPTYCLVPIAMPAPVCGCDALWYDFECLAHMTGMNIGSDGDCGSATPCLENPECGEGEYCMLENCAADSGNCTSIPDLCTPFPPAVCGCNGETHINACWAAMSNVSIDTTGAACTPVTCTKNSDCDNGQFCFRTTCGTTDKGLCEDIPLTCRITANEVCGCDGTLYQNECLAKKGSVSVDATGTACQTAITCGSNKDCTASQYCAKSSCAATRGTCTALAKACPIADIPVCGCDGVIYKNACRATWGRVNVQPDENCMANGLCSTLKACQAKVEFCLTGSCGGAGLCHEKPIKCETTNYPVCGCNGITYSSPCEANKVGITVQSEGSCK